MPIHFIAPKAGLDLLTIRRQGNEHGRESRKENPVHLQKPPMDDKAKGAAKGKKGGFLTK